MPPEPWPKAAAQVVPPPRQIELSDETFPLPLRLTAAWRGDKARREHVVARLNDELDRAGMPPAMIGLQPADVHLEIDADASLDAEGYRLQITSQGIHLEAATATGLFYGMCTLVQWIRIHRMEGRVDITGRIVLTGVRIRDRPDFPHRGVMLDVSRDKVPTLDELFGLIDRLASWKINQIQLYTEHTFAYSKHEKVWADASPFTAEEIRRIDGFCRERFIELVPNQNSFGHMHRWLTHEPYNAWSEVPEGVEHPFTLDEKTREPFSLCPLDPESTGFLEGLYDELLPCFESKLFNVGLDETFDLGEGRSAASCEERGKGRVYLEFLRRIHELVEARGRRMLFWGDVILQRPELIEELPEDVVALEWGYEADHPFAEDCARFAAAGREFWVCPGTSSWNSLAGRWDNARRNLASAARYGKERGARGFLITDWGDHGHLQAPIIRLPGLIAGAAAAWNAADAEDIDDSSVARWLDLFALEDVAGKAGRLLLDLGNLYLAPHTSKSGPPMNGSALFFLLVFAGQKREAERVVGVTESGLESTLTRIEQAEAELSKLKLEGAEAEQIRNEARWTIDLLRCAAQFGAARLAAGGLDRPLGEIPRETRESLADQLDALATSYLDVARARHREGGLDRGAARLRRVEALLRS